MCVDDRLEKPIMIGMGEGKRKRGRAHEMDEIKDTTNDNGPS